MKAVFLSGSRAISRLNQEIRERLAGITSQAFQILVGDANGADKALQGFLKKNHYSKVTVYCSGGHCRNNVGSWETYSRLGSCGSQRSCPAKALIDPAKP